jgi:hypothetical protein
MTFDGTMTIAEDPLEQVAIQSKRKLDDEIGTA